MNPDIWGQNAWYVLHYLGLVNDRDGYSKDIVKFFTIFVLILMCKSCREHGSRFQDLMDSIGKGIEEMARADRLFEYTWYLHNLVDDRLDKPRMQLENARERWRQHTMDPREDEDDDEEGLIRRRMLSLWEFITRVCIHYDQNQDAGRKENYRVLLSILPSLIHCFGEERVSADKIQHLASKAVPFSSASLLRFLYNIMKLLRKETNLPSIDVQHGILRCQSDYLKSKNPSAASWCENFQW